MNQFETTLKVKRIEIIDLMIACLAAKEIALDGGRKWENLHDKLKKQLDELDEQLERIANN